jgi:hypothetical protein
LHVDITILNPFGKQLHRLNACGNGIMSSDINCQNLGNQVDRDHNADNVKGIRPSSSFDVIAHANDDYNGHNNRHNDHRQQVS